MDFTSSVLDWIADNESLFSGLVAIAALVGITITAARILWVRAQPSPTGGLQKASVWRFALPGVMLTAAAAWFTFNVGHDDSTAPEGPTGPPTIAVLPFTSMSGESEHELLSDGLTEDIITLLAQSPALRVIARNSTFQYKGQSVDIRTVGEALGADFVVEGSIRPLGERIRVTVQLIDSESGTHVWADKFDRPLTGLFAIQDEVTTGIAAALGDEVFKVESIRATQATSENLDAWGLTWRADANYSVDDARRAIELDRNYARAHAVYGRNLARQLLTGTRDPDKYKEAVAAARLGAELAPRDVIVLTHLGVTLLWSGDPEQALQVIERVPKMSPSYAEGIVWYGDVLIHNGLAEDGLKFVNKGIALTPQARTLWVYEIIRAEALIHLGRFDAALKDLRNAHLADSVPLSLSYHAGVEAILGNTPEAKRIIDQILEGSPDVSITDYRESYNLVSSDDGGENWRRLFDAFEAAAH